MVATKGLDLQSILVWKFYGQNLYRFILRHSVQTKEAAFLLWWM